MDKLLHAKLLLKSVYTKVCLFQIINWNPFGVMHAEVCACILLAKVTCISMPALHDFSSVFDTIDHFVLVHCLHTNFGFSDIAIQ